MCPSTANLFCFANFSLPEKLKERFSVIVFTIRLHVYNCLYAFLQIWVKLSLLASI